MSVQCIMRLWSMKNPHKHIGNHNKLDIFKYEAIQKPLWKVFLILNRTLRWKTEADNSAVAGVVTELGLLMQFVAFTTMQLLFLSMIQIVFFSLALVSLSSQSEKVLPRTHLNLHLNFCATQKILFKKRRIFSGSCQN